MKAITLLAMNFLFLSVFATPYQSKDSEEPQYYWVFHYLDPSDSKLKPLEKQTPALSSKVGAFGYGKSRAVYEIKGKSSPVRFKVGERIEIIVRGMSEVLDPTDYVALARLDSKKDTRELILVKTGIRGMGSKAKDAFRDGITYQNSKYGSSSLRITPSVELDPGEYVIQTRMSQHLFCFGVDARNK